MVCHTVFALIQGDMVRHVIVGEYEECNQIARMDYGDKAFAVEVTRIPVTTGDIYRGGTFYRSENGTEIRINPIPTEADQIIDLQAQITSLKEAIQQELNAVSLAVLDMASETKEGKNG